MKKTYIIPEIEVIRMKMHQQMLAGSTGDANNSLPDIYGSHEDDENFDW